MKANRSFPLLDTGVLTLCFVFWLLMVSVLVAVAVVLMVIPALIPIITRGMQTYSMQEIMDAAMAPMKNPYLLFVLTGIAELLLIVPLIVYLRIKKMPVRALLGNRVSARQNILALLLGLLLSPALLGLDALCTALFQALGATMPDSSVLEPKTLGVLILGIFAIGVSAGIVEEPIFRGVTLRGLGSVSGKWAAILLSSVLFSLVHMEAVGFLTRFLVGVMLGMLAWRCGSIVPGIFTHAAFNTSALLTSYVFAVVLPDWNGFSFLSGVQGGDVLSQVLLSLPFIAAAWGAYRLFATATPPEARWSNRPYAGKAAAGSHWLPWAAAAVMVVCLTLVTMAAMWLPGLEQYFSGLQGLPN